MNSAKIKREIISLALLADELTELAVWIDYSPHVSQISVKATKSKEEWREEIFKGRFYYDFHYDDDLEKYQRIKDFLTEEIRKVTEIS